MNLSLTKDQFLELIAVYIIEEAKNRGKELLLTDTQDLDEYERLLVHISKFPMESSLKMAKHNIEPKIKVQGKRLMGSLNKADDVRIIIG
jgi:hypothetical protein